jgi:hypothetical protein
MLAVFNPNEKGKGIEQPWGSDGVQRVNPPKCFIDVKDAGQG